MGIFRRRRPQPIAVGSFLIVADRTSAHVRFSGHPLVHDDVVTALATVTWAVRYVLLHGTTYPEHVADWLSEAADAADGHTFNAQCNAGGTFVNETGREPDLDHARATAVGTMAILPTHHLTGTWDVAATDEAVDAQRLLAALWCAATAEGSGNDVRHGLYMLLGAHQQQLVKPGADLTLPQMLLDFGSQASADNRSFGSYDADSFAQAAAASPATSVARETAGGYLPGWWPNVRHRGHRTANGSYAFPTVDRWRC